MKTDFLNSSLLDKTKRYLVTSCFILKVWLADFHLWLVCFHSVYSHLCSSLYKKSWSPFVCLITVVCCCQSLIWRISFGLGTFFGDVCSCCYYGRSSCNLQLWALYLECYLWQLPSSTMLDGRWEARDRASVAGSFNINNSTPKQRRIDGFWRPTQEDGAMCLEFESNCT